MFVEQPAPVVETLSKPEPEPEPLPEITQPPKAAVEQKPGMQPESEPLPEITTPPKAVVAPEPEITQKPQPTPAPPPVKSVPKLHPVAKVVQSATKPEAPLKTASLPSPPPAPKPPESTPPVKPQVAEIKIPEDPGPDAEMLAQEEHHYRLEIIKRIENNKFFPKRARKMRQTGDVVVEFTLMRDGSLSEAKVLKSTAPSILEKAALKAIQVSALFPPFPEIIHRDSWSFQTSLEYRLR